jgi:hypothetical protein
MTANEKKKAQTIDCLDGVMFLKIKLILSRLKIT